MRRLKRRDDAFKPRAQLERLQRLFVGDRHILRATGVMQPGMFRADARVIETGRDRKAFQNLAIIILQQIGAVAVQHTGAATSQASAMLHPVVNAFATGLDPDDIY